jgi:sulfide:quinone oxidoreductase
MTRVLVAGAGVAAVECVLALRELAGSQVEIELLAPAPELVHRPASVQTPFGADAAPRIDLSALAGELGVVLWRDSLAAVATAEHHVVTRGADERHYDFLVVATGAPSRDAVPGAVTFRGPLSAGAVEGALARVAADPELRLVFAAPAGTTWPLPIYELALLSAAALRKRGVTEPDITVVTAEPTPLAALGAEAGEALVTALSRAGVDLVTDAAATFAIEGALETSQGRMIGADIVVALPALVGPRIPGLPDDGQGFIPIDEHCRVEGHANVFAAGDAAAFAVKHGSLATQQADAAAAAIAAQVGAIAEAEPFAPVLHGMLLTGGDPLYIRAELGSGATVSNEPLWTPAGKIVGRYLSRFLTPPLQR